MNTVSREMAERLEKAGWERETQLVHFFDYASKEWRIETPVYVINYPYVRQNDILPAPGLSELKGEVSYEDLCRYHFPNFGIQVASREALRRFSLWLYSLTPDGWAEVWIWKEGNKPRIVESADH